MLLLGYHEYLVSIILHIGGYSITYVRYSFSYIAEEHTASQIKGTQPWNDLWVQVVGLWSIKSKEQQIGGEGIPPAGHRRALSVSIYHD